MKPTALLILLIAIYSAECSKILVVFPMPASSHYILGNALARGLAEAGHDVTMISSFEERNPPKNGSYRDVVLTGFLEEKDKNSNFNFFDLESMNPFFNIPFMNFVGNKATSKTLEHPNLKKLLNSNEHFDAVIIEQFNDDALKVLAYHYKAPLILFSTITVNAWVNFLVGNPAPPSYIPEIFLSYTSQMTFRQRLVNWLFFISSELNRQLFFFPAQNKMMKEHFPDAPDLSILNYNASLVLVNSHESINQPVPHVPNMIDIGGFHVSATKELPKDLKDFMDNAKEGVVYFSMGSNIKPSQMSDEKRTAILNALGKIKQKVLWKWNEDTLPGKPSNVRLSKWFPQQDILAHPNTKLFVTHGGLLSTIETIYHGVPILALPIFGDQKMNAARAETNGYGFSLAFSEITEEKLTKYLNLLLNDPQYRDNAKQRSILMHDRPMKPIDLAVYWTEFVIRHKGAPHLRVAGVDLPLYKYLLLDVISFIVLVSAAFIFLIYFIVKKICCGRRKSEDKLKKN
ncbi:UDP-glucuronosyltransferase 1-8 [Anoplophora glabripennis]|uniref:UDP-glucuronosyltransferase 1-8 n=1 Tax=Anoplophora glabripennis TaxID=217634 RepID=UPI0008735C4D|nr:UDP-glucuronosyltransferase 1-8 [Anoplophora glabripennis]